LTTTALTEPTLTRNVALKTITFVAWQVEESLPTSRYALGVVAAPNDNYLYAVGGWHNGFSGDPYAERASSALDRYNVCTRQWASLAQLPEARANSGVGFVNGEIYLLGGSSYILSTDFYAYKTYASVFAYELA